jgi:predicted AAA+ superfamily ATPase
MEIRRSLYAQVKAHLQEPEITLVIGPRQAGKTTLLRALAAELKAQDEAVLFFNLDIDRDAAFFELLSVCFSFWQADQGSKSTSMILL